MLLPTAFILFSVGNKRDRGQKPPDKRGQHRRVPARLLLFFPFIGSIFARSQGGRPHPGWSSPELHRVAAGAGSRPVAQPAGKTPGDGNDPREIEECAATGSGSPAGDRARSTVQRASTSEHGLRGQQVTCASLSFSRRAALNTTAACCRTLVQSAASMFRSLKFPTVALVPELLWICNDCAHFIIRDKDRIADSVIV